MDLNKGHRYELVSQAIWIELYGSFTDKVGNHSE